MLLFGVRVMNRSQKSDLGWDRMLKALTTFKKKHGHTNVPSDYPRNPRLGRWVAAQRYKRKSGDLPPARVKQLDRLDFIWSPADRAWEEMYQALKDFAKRYGHCEVPSNWPKNRQLAVWVQRQRHRRKKNLLPPDRVRRLNEVGFVWRIYKSAEKKAPPEEPVAPLPEDPPEHTHRLYYLGNNTYVQHDGRRKMPAHLQEFVTEHRGEFPPYIPLPARKVDFYFGPGILKQHRVRWNGKGALPDRVLSYVKQHGTLPPHDW